MIAVSCTFSFNVKATLWIFNCLLCFVFFGDVLTFCILYHCNLGEFEELQGVATWWKNINDLTTENPGGKRGDYSVIWQKYFVKLSFKSTTDFLIITRPLPSRVSLPFACRFPSWKNKEALHQSIPPSLLICFKPTLIYGVFRIMEDHTNLGFCEVPLYTIRII